MEYQIYKFEFLTPVHFGTGTLDSSSCSFLSDTLFSALCQEAVSEGEDALDQLVTYAREDKIRFSDAFPYIDDEYYLPKPVMYVGKNTDEGNSKTKKLYKNLKYIASSQFHNYLSGDFDPENARNRLKNLGHSAMKVSANIQNREDTRQYRNNEEADPGVALPYRIGIYRFSESSGLYIIVGYQDEDARAFVEDLLINLSYSGIGGRRSAGLGKFELKKGKNTENLQQVLSDDEPGMQMLLSQALPAENEIEKVLQNATYLLVKRSGFVNSPNYADEFRRKRDLYVFASGSVFQHRFHGNIYDVGDGGRHAVYRYSKPLFIRLSREVINS